MKISLYSKKLFIPLLLFIGLFLILLPIISQASYKVEIGLPYMTSRTFSDPGAYIRILFIFGLSLAGFLAVGAIAWGGIQYMLASSVGSTQKAKDLIVGSLSGIVLLLCAYLILATIDPTLTNLTPTIQPVGDITKPATNTTTDTSANYQTPTTQTYDAPVQPQFIGQ